MVSEHIGEEGNVKALKIFINNKINEKIDTLSNTNEKLQKDTLNQIEKLQKDNQNIDVIHEKILSKIFILYK